MADDFDARADEFIASRGADSFGTRADAFIAAKAKEDAALRNGVIAATETTPQKVAQQRYLAKVTGLPEDIVKTEEGQAKALAKYKEINEQAQFSPVLRAHLQDPNFTAVAVDETPLLAKIEKGIQGTAKFVMGADGEGGLPSYAAKSAQLAYHQSMRGLSGVSRAATDLLDQFLPNFDPNSPDLLRAFSENSARVSAYHDAKAKEITYQGNVVGEGVQSGISSALSQAKYMPLLAFGPAGAAAALGGMIAETFGQTYNEHRDAGNAPIASLMQAIPDAGIEGGTEVGPMFNLATDLAKGTPFLKSLVKQAFPEIKGEEVATFFQDFNQWVRDPNPNKKFSDFIAERPRAAVVTAIATLFGTGGNIAVSRGIDKVMEGQLQREWEPVIKQHTALQELVKQASGSQVRELDPERFKAFVQAAADNTEGAPKSAFVDGRVLGEVLQQAGITPDVLASTLPSIAAQLEAAHQSNSPVEIPIGELATALPGTKLEESLLPHLRMDGPESLSQVEAVHARDNAQELLSKKFADVMQQAQDSERMAAGAKMVQDAMHTQLMATGRMSEDVAARNAALVKDYYTVMAGYLNTTPDALWIKQQYNVAAQGKQTGVLTDTGKAGALTLEGYHYSTQARPIISGHAYGSGLKGSNQEMYTTAADKRLRNRSYFYVDTGNGITPEAGVGGIGHRVNLSNIYDANSDPLRLRKGGQLAFESAVLDRGYDGYLDRLSGTQPGQVVVLGDKQLKAEVLGPLGNTTGKKAPPMVERPARGRDQVVDRVSANKTLPMGSPSLERWGEILKAQMPDDYAAMKDAGVFEGDLAKPMYKSELVKLFESKTENPVYEQSATLRNGQETLLKYGLAPGGKYNTREIAAALEARQREKWGKIDPADRSAESAEKIAAWMAEEVRFEMLHPRKSGVGWYSYKFQRALDTFGEVFPELKKNKDARATLTALIAITSDGQKVVPNFRMAVDLYRNFRETGKFTTERGHARMEAIQGNIDLLQLMLDDMGPKAARKYLLQEASVSDLRKMAKAEGVEFKTDYQAHIKLPMAAVTFGPKLGAFYANLMGSHGYLTMDRWWSRTFNRYRGTLLQAPTREGLDRIKELNGHPEWSDDEAISATVEPRNSYAAKNFKNGTELEKASNTVYKAAFENLEDTPFNATDRTFMLDAVGRAQKMLAAEGRKISVADIQAVLWYYEKRLYGELGARQTADVSYEDAAGKVATELANAGGPGGPITPGLGADAGGDVATAEAGVSEETVAPGLDPFTEDVKPSTAEPLAQGARATLNDFSPERIGGILQKNDWSILTAENPMGQQASPEENAAKMAELKADLDAMGAQYVEAVGKYGQVENSLVVTGITQAEAVALGAKYAQDSVLTKRGLVYPRTGGVTPVTGKVDVFAEAPEDFYTTIPSTGAKFAVELDWREGANDYSIRKTDTGFEALDIDGKVIGKLESNITPEQSKQINESASVDIVKVNDERKGQGVGSALYAAWSAAHEGHITPSGKTSPDAWKLWKRNYPEKVAEFVQQEATRIAGGAPSEQVLGNITDPEIKQAVVDAVPNKYQVKYAAGRNPGLLNQEEKAQYNALSTPQTETPAFKEWFGDSKVVDADGKPLVVYHTTTADFDTFDTTRRAIGGEGSWFSSTPANMGGEEGERVMPVYLSLQNPKVIDHSRESTDVLKQQFMAQGHDGVVMTRNGKIIQAVAFDPAQIKSAIGNNGKFSPTNPNILTQPAEKEVIRGTFDVSTMTTVLNAEQNLSTFLHETGHFFLEMTMNLAAGPDAPPQIVKMSQDLLKSFGVKDMATWQAMSVDQKRKHHERFAETFELYLLEGKAPSREQQTAFRVFSSWLKRVYQSAKAFAEKHGGLGHVDPDLASVMDRMLATEEQIKEAEETAGLLPDFDATAEANEKLNARSIRDLKWAVNARNKFIKAMQMEAKDTRRNVKAEVTAEVNEMDVFKAKEQLAKMRKENGEQLNATELAIMAEGYGFKGTDDMLRSIDAAGNKADVIEGMTDQRMLERHGDLSDQRAIEQAATEAVHNQARAKALATELTAQQEMLNTRGDTGKTNAAGRKITVNSMAAAAKQFAENVIGKRKVSDLRKAAWAHTQAERRAGQAWQEATKKGDTKAAVQAKQDQLLNNAAVREAQDAMRQVQETLAFFAKVTKGNDETVVEKGRDPDIVNAARVILAAYGYAPFKGKKAAEYLDLVKTNNPDTFVVIEEGVRSAIENARPMKDLTTDELNALRDEIASLWHLAKSSRHYEVAGNAMDIDDVSERITARLVEKGVPEVMPGDFHAPTKADGSRTMLQFAGALLRRTEAWSQTMDGKFGGPFLRYIFQPIKDAANRYNNDRVTYRKKYQALVENLAPALKQGEIAAPELGYTFGHRESADHPNLGAAELTAALLHLGNDSNKRKLLLGRGWATEVDGVMDTSKWDAFMERMHREGTINKAHYDFAQGVWDLLESMKPLAQKAHRDAFGRYFSEVTAQSFEVPDIGFYRGGYVPAQTDPRMVKDHEVAQLRELENQSMAYAFPSVSKGFTIARTEYNRPLMLNLNTLSQHMDKVLLFSHMTGPVRGVGRVLSDKGVAYNLNRVDPAAISGLLTPWLKRSASQQVETPMLGDGKLSRVASIVRSRAGMSLMFANISNTVQQITGFALAGVKVKPSHLANATAEYVKAPRQMAENVANASAYMAHRMENEISAINAAMEDILVNPTTYQRAKTWTNRHGYFMQSALDNVMSTIVWTGAFNQATEQGMTQADAVQFADGSVRQTQGANAAEDVSRIEVGPAYARLFTQFYGYFSMMANTNVTAIENLTEEFGLKKGMAKAVPVVLMGYMASAWIAEAIAQAFKGGPGDDDKDGSYLGDWLRAVFVNGSVKAVLAAVPFVGQFAGTMFNTWNSKPYDDKTSVSPGISMLDNAVRAPHSVYKAIAEGGSVQAAVRDVGTAISMATGLPAAPLARPVGYAAGVAAGEIRPTGPVDVARGLITGTASPESKQ